MRHWQDVLEYSSSDISEHDYAGEGFLTTVQDSTKAKYSEKARVIVTRNSFLAQQPSRKRHESVICGTSKESLQLSCRSRSCMPASGPRIARQNTHIPVLHTQSRTQTERIRIRHPSFVV